MLVYNANSTMKMLGKQCSIPLIEKEGIAGNDFQDVLSAHEANGTSDYFSIAMDAFMLGYIYGKRAERARKRTA